MSEFKWGHIRGDLNSRLVQRHPSYSRRQRNLGCSPARACSPVHHKPSLGLARCDGNRQAPPPRVLNWRNWQIHEALF